ncbi:hypothetical protein DC3_57320 [Deinococcus cellulosilyticus NBRC 106333 = KACC 11606]|uniref:Uncharacterized protein n=1 Tax=Deinococcus cellulosilyticus (strain DSM 18568 / NBRC 106333 / KACC 11606 / 5516J-15) TaxID=1223518 RepID=A0A511NBX3_DEIC1|nr:hypothetical protein DC3_57320 [Deinococcus cellulosilyticus NBRC 106333 = KACC 11606]
MYGVLSNLGFSRPGAVWKQLLARCEADLPEHTRMQFEKANGRKGRLVPAIREEDARKLVDLVREMMGQEQKGWFYLPAERQLVELLTDAFAEHQSESPCELQGVVVDVFFHRCKVAVVFQGAGENFPVDRLQEHGVRVLEVRVCQEDFRPGTLVREICRIIESEAGTHSQF